MQENIKNKTILGKIRHRATHTGDAMWASFMLSFMIILLVVGVLQSKMWKDRTFLSNQVETNLAK